jgi:hypothetical protein
VYKEPTERCQKISSLTCNPLFKTKKNKDYYKEKTFQISNVIFHHQARAAPVTARKPGDSCSLAPLPRRPCCCAFGRRRSLSSLLPSCAFRRRLLPLSSRRPPPRRRSSTTGASSPDDGTRFSYCKLSRAVAELDGKWSGGDQSSFHRIKAQREAIVAFTPPEFTVRDPNPGPPLMIPLEK